MDMKRLNTHFTFFTHINISVMIKQDYALHSSEMTRVSTYAKHIVYLFICLPNGKLAPTAGGLVTMT